MSFIGSHGYAHSTGASRLVEGRHHHFQRKLLMPDMFVGMGLAEEGGEVEQERVAQGTDHLDHGPQRLA